MGKTFFSCLFLLSFTPFTCISGGPMPVHHNDSLAIVRLVRPLNDLPAAVYVGKGLGKVTAVELSGTLTTDVRTATETALGDFLRNGYRLENSTDYFKDGLHISTFYLKKRTT